MSTLTASVIRKFASSQSFSRGQSLFNDDAISGATKRGDRYTARCAASSRDDDYRLSVRIVNGEIRDTRCDCLYEYGGYCKHIVALLLTIAENPAAFKEVLPLDVLLKDHSRDDLVALIVRLVDHDSDLMALIERPVIPSKPGKQAVAADVYSRQVRKALTQHPQAWGDSPLANALSTIVDDIKTCIDRKDWHSASAIARAALDEIFGNFDESPYMDEQGWALESVESATNLLIEALPHLVSEETERRPVIETLTAGFLWQLTMGWADGADPEDAILEHAQPADLREVRARVEHAKSHPPRTSDSGDDEYDDDDDDEIFGDEVSGEWYQEGLAEYLYRIDIKLGVAPDILIDRLRGEKRYGLLFEALLADERLDEAVETASKHLNAVSQQFSAFRLLLAHGHKDEAARVLLAIKPKKGEIQYDGILDGIVNGLKALGRIEEAYERRLAQVQDTALMLYYDDLETMATALGRWEADRAALVKAWERKGLWDGVIDAAMREKAWGEAWKALDKRGTPRTNPFGMAGYMGRQIDLELAELSRREFPERAIRVFRHYIDTYIGWRDRGYYQLAANLLKMTLECYDDAGQPDEGYALVEQIRRQYPKLPALHDELNKAGL